jgi:putative AdoMet-dependent methyltransferase
MNKISDIYDQIASDYAHKRHQPSEKMKLAIPYLKSGMKILDLGCGPGQFYGLMPSGCQYVGLDFSKKLLAIAQSRYPQTQFIFGDMTNEKVWTKLGKFDQIFSLASFHHLMTQKQQEKVLKFCFQALKPKGLLMIVVWNLFSSSQKKVIKPWKLSDGQKVIKTVYRPYYAFTSEELKNLVQKAGFKVKKSFFVANHKEFGLVATR